MASRSGGLEGPDRETLPTVLDLPFYMSSASFYFLSHFIELLKPEYRYKIRSINLLLSILLFEMSWLLPELLYPYQFKIYPRAYGVSEAFFLTILITCQLWPWLRQYSKSKNDVRTRESAKYRYQGQVPFSIERVAASFGSKRKWAEERSFCKQLQ
jgi:hypothetical protein